MTFEDQMIETTCLRAWDIVEQTWSGWKEDKSCEFPQFAYMRAIFKDIYSRNYHHHLLPHPFRSTFVLARTVDLKNWTLPRIIFLPRLEKAMDVELHGADVRCRVHVNRAEITPPVDDLLRALLVYPFDHLSLLKDDFFYL